MIDASAADQLLREWARGELGEIRKLWYPATTPAFKHYRGGFRESFTGNSDALREKVGLALADMHPALRSALKRKYLGGTASSYRIIEMAMFDFRRAWTEISPAP